MKLYYSPGACSLASHIALIEANLEFDKQAVDLKTHETDGHAFSEINPKNKVPALELNDGQVLTENAIVLQFIADQARNMNLIPPHGDFDRYRAEEWLNFIASDLHKGFGVFFDPTSSEEVKKKSQAKLMTAFEFANAALMKQKFLMGDTVTVPDFYLFVMLKWGHKFEFEFSRLQGLEDFYRTMNSRPSVKQALNEEGLH